MKKLVVYILTALFLLSGCSADTKDIPMQLVKQEDQRLARINIRDFGSVTFRLFPGREPGVVNDFIRRCNTGFYNGSSFFNVIDDYLIMGGIESEGAGDKVKAGDGDALYPFTGALCVNKPVDGMCRTDSFFVITLDKDQLANIEELLQYKGYTLDDYVRFGYKTELSTGEVDLFTEYGGAPWLTGHVVVFGQAIEGMEVFDAIREALSLDSETEVVIESIETD
ncbi:MAG: peptidylprolyl isomerase [Lachnospiraceae bacterium]|nr:peptidylprolyl isomerase [Lachnospiraceae bacterium]